jgi:hypothetical protein
VRTAPQWLPWIRPQGWRYRSDRILHTEAIMLFLFYVQVVGKFPHKYTKPGTNSLRVFMRSKYSQHVLAFLSPTENSTSPQFFNLISHNVCRGLNRDILTDKLIKLQVFTRFNASLVMLVFKKCNNLCNWLSVHTKISQPCSDLNSKTGLGNLICLSFQENQDGNEINWQSSADP